MRIDIRDSKYSIIYNEKTGANKLSTSILVLSRKRLPCPLLWPRS